MSVRLKPITEAKRINPDKVVKEVNKALKTTLETGRGYFKRTTNSWNTEVSFEIHGPIEGEGAVGTDNDIYEYVTRGTRPHIIEPRRASWLVFGEGKYKAKSTPGVLGSKRVGTGLQGAGGVARPIFAKRVRHPGTKARGFEQVVAVRLQPVLENQITAALLRSME